MKNKTNGNINKKDNKASKKQGSVYQNQYDLMAGLILIIVPFVLTSLTYFYANYIVYSLLGFVILLFLTFYWLPKLSIYQKFSIAIWIVIPLIYLATTIIFIPYFLHNYIIDKRYECYSAKLKRMTDVGGIGRIYFDIDYTKDLPREMMFVHAMDVDIYQYDNLPKKGTKIRICGEISKIGFSFDYIETASDENVSGVP